MFSDDFEDMESIWNKYAADLEFLNNCSEIMECVPDRHVPFTYSAVRHFKPDTKKRRKILNINMTMQAIRQAKHSITNEAMKDFVAIARHPDFDPWALRHGDQARRDRDRFPLLPV